MEARLVGAGRGWGWIAGGFNLFRKNPLIWIALTLIMFVIALILGRIPFIGALLFYLVSPAFIAGLLLGCRTLDEGGELEIAHLFAGFRQRHAGRLVAVGGVYLVGQIFIVGLMLIGGGGAFSAATHGIDAGAAMGTVGAMLVTLAFGLALSIPLMMAIWFAPALILFDELDVKSALVQSFNACLKNMASFLVYGLILFGLAILAAIPFGLGMFVLWPTILGSIYVSYREIFTGPGERGVVIVP